MTPGGEFEGADIEVEISVVDPDETPCVARFVSDVTVDDRTEVAPGEAVTKIWRVRNTGRANWAGGHLAWEMGSHYSGLVGARVPAAAGAAGEEVDLTVQFRIPRGARPGETLKSVWRLLDADGFPFYVDDESDGSSEFVMWIEVVVASADEKRTRRPPMLERKPSYERRRRPGGGFARMLCPVNGRRGFEPLAPAAATAARVRRRDQRARAAATRASPRPPRRARAAAAAEAATAEAAAAEAAPAEAAAAEAAPAVVPLTLALLEAMLAREDALPARARRAGRARRGGRGPRRVPRGDRARAGARRARVRLRRRRRGAARGRRRRAAMCADALLGAERAARVSHYRRHNRAADGPLRHGDRVPDVALLALDGGASSLARAAPGGAGGTRAPSSRGVLVLGRGRRRRRRSRRRREFAPPLVLRVLGSHS